MQGSSRSCSSWTFRFSDPGLLLQFRLGLRRFPSFRFPRPQYCSQPPPAPSPRRHLGKVVLLTSFFTSVRSSSVRDGAVGSMAEAGDGGSSGSRSSGCAAPPRLRASAFEWRGRREAERVGKERAAPSRTDGLVSQTVAPPAEPRVQQTSLSKSGDRSPGSFSLREAQEQAPPLGGATGRARPVSTAANQSQPAGHPCPRPLPEPFRSGSAHSLLSVSVWQSGGLPEGNRFRGWGA